MSAPSSSQVGTVATIALMPWPWPPKQQLLFTRVAIIGGEMRLTGNADGTLTFSLEGQSTVTLTSCPIVVPSEFSAAPIIVTWNLPAITMGVGRTIVISTETTNTVPDQCVITGRIPNDIRDFSKESADAVKKRKGRLTGTHPKPNRRQKTNAELFDDLGNEVSQIRDLLQHVDDGKLYHLVGLSSRLRALVADVPSLLQTCAAVLDSPLTVYVPPIVRTRNRKEPNRETLSLAFAIGIHPTGVARNPADLDVWLDSDAARINGTISSQRELLAHIGNTVGSHVDRDVHPSIDALRQLRIGLDGQDLDSITRYIITVARVACHLSSTLLSEFSHRTSRG
jgi:hypothetical protein